MTVVTNLPATRKTVSRAVAPSSAKPISARIMQIPSALRCSARVRTPRISLVAGRSVTTVIGLVGFAATAIYETVAGLAVIFRVLSRKIIVESGSLGPMIVVLAVAILLLTRLLSKYHRTSATE
jgi:hypothetical protein